ncbi:MAG: flagellar biosynthesis protein FlhF [Thiogranum sp.]|nr:flagellar biosynthesis protein FlhF [Thiogranum sp.]
MKVKRFFAADMRQAIRLVREEQGPDAVILSNRKVDGGIEIIAAQDFDESVFNDNTREPGTEAGAPAVEPATSTYVNAPAQPASATVRRSAAMDWAQDPAIVSMREEIRQLRGLLENQLAHLAWGDLQRTQPLQADAMRKLSAMELDASLVERLSAPAARARNPQEAWRATIAELSASIPVAPHEMIEQDGVIALVGSTGVGKTTTVAKLAARYVLRYGQRHVALVTTDSYRIGAHEQLMTYGRLLGIPVQVASDQKELRSTLHSLADKRLVLIDTAGMSQRDVRLTEQFSTLADTGIPIRTLLVLSATAHASVLNETVRAFTDIPLDGAILTKLDEAASLGGVLSAVIHQRLQLTFVANGQRVPEDIHLARVEDLAQQAAMLGSSASAVHETVLAETFGGFRANVHV